MKILLRLPTWLGDAVMAAPTLQALKSHYPQASLTLVGSEVSIDLFSQEKAVLLVDESKKSKSRLLSLYQLAQKIGKHDVAITLQNNFPSALLLFFTGSTQRIGYAKNLRSPLLTHAIKAPSKLHQVQRYLNLLSPLGIQAQRAELDLGLRAHKSEGRIRIGINAGAKYGSAKRWNQEGFTQVIAELLHRGYEVILYGGKEEREGNGKIIGQLRSIAPMEHFIDLTAKTTIPELIKSMSGLHAFLTNDSGPMHIASALGLPLVAIFGPTDTEETYPYNTQSPQILINKHLPCSPCKKRECPLSHHLCMQSITPQEVLEALLSLLPHQNKNQRAQQ